MKRVSMVVALSFVALFSAACQGKSSEAAAGTESIPCEMEATTFKQYVEKSRIDAGYVLLDVRTPSEFAQGYIDGAINLDFNAVDFRDRLSALSRDRSYLVYCRSGNRSGQSLAVMKELGFASVGHLSGGIGAWTAQGYTLVK